PGSRAGNRGAGARGEWAWRGAATDGHQKLARDHACRGAGGGAQGDRRSTRARALESRRGLTDSHGELQDSPPQDWRVRARATVAPTVLITGLLDGMSDGRSAYCPMSVHRALSIRSSLPARTPRAAQIRASGC